MKKPKKSMITMLSLLLALVFLPLLSKEVLADNNTSSSATVISVNSLTKDNLTSSSDVNWYRATISSAGYISLNFNHDNVKGTPGYVYWYVDLYDASITKLARYQFRGNETSYTGPNIGVPSGTYYVEVTSSDYSDVDYWFTLNYTVASNWEKEFNDTQQTAHTISANIPVNGSMRSRDDKDWYKVTVSSAGNISLNFNHDNVKGTPGYVYWYVDLYDASITKLARYQFRGNETSYTGPNIGVPSGTYYVEVTSSDFSDVDYWFTLDFTEASYWEKEFNDTQQTAHTISANIPVNGSMRSKDDKDWYKVTISSAGYISLNFNHDNVKGTPGYVYWYVDLYDASVTKLARYQFRGNETSYTGPNIGVPSGTYYVEVTSSDYSDVDYWFTLNFTVASYWEKEFNDTQKTAHTISANIPVNGSMRSRDDKDWYKVTVSSAGYISLNFNHDNVEGTPGYVYWYVDLYDASITKLARYQFRGNETSYTGPNIGIPSGTYYVEVTSSDFSDVDYWFTLDFTETSYWEKEFNDTQQTAQAISANVPVSGSMRSGDDKDWYKMNVTSSGYISLAFNNSKVKGSPGYTYWYVDLYDASTNKLARYKFNGNETYYTGSHIGVSSGTYYVEVTPNDFSNVDYTLRLFYSDILNIANMTCSLSNTSYVYDGTEKKPGITIKDGDKTLIEGTDYTVAYSNNINVGTANLKITGRGNFSGTKTITFTIKSVSGETETKGNELIFHTDCWNFDNQSPFEAKLTSAQMNQLKKACGSEECFQYLKDYWTDNKKGEKFDDEGNVVFKGGICYGMSCAVILNKMKSPLLANNLNKVSKNQFAPELSFYHISQKLPAIERYTIQYLSEPDSEKILELERKAAAVKEGGTPVLFCFGADGWGAHGVVAYKVQTGSFPGRGDTYDHRILIYDCNEHNFNNKVPQFNENRCLLYNHRNNKWEIPAYYNDGVHSGTGYIQRCLTDLDIMNPYGSAHNGNSSENINIITLSNTTAMTLQAGNWKASGSNMGLTSKTKGTVSFYDSDIAVGTKDLKLNVIPPSNLSTIKVSTKKGSAGDLDVQCLMKGAYHNISCDRAKSVTVNKDGTFTIHGNNGNFDIRTTVSNGTTYKITGTAKNSGDIKVVKKDKLVATGNKAVGVKITVTKASDSKSKSYVVTTTKGYTVDASSKSLKKGSAFTAGKAKYKVTKAGVSGLAEAQYKAPKNKNYSSAAIPNTVKYKGITYKVTSIADKAFRNNKKLKKVTIGTNVTKIGKEAFLNCNALTKVTIGTGVKTIGASAFQGCVKLASITIPAKVTKIGKNAFYRDKKLKTIRILTTKLTTKNVGADALKGIYTKATIKVPKKKLKAYKKWLVKKGIGKKVKIKGA